jgi:uncharacterized membrane protein
VPRHQYLDWVRGLAVVLMIQTHVFNAWPAAHAKVGAAWQYFNLSGGAPAPLFLFLAGVSLALLLRGAERSGLTLGGGLVKALRRAGWLLGVAFLLRLWFYLAGGARHPEMLLRVDILNCMAVSLALAALVGFRAARGRWNLAPAALGLAVSLTSPIVATHWPAAWGQVVPHAYVYGDRPISVFPIFPWAAFTLVGLSAGTLWTSTREPAALARLMGATTLLGAALVILGWVSWRPQQAIFGHLEAWRTGPAYFLLRVGLLLITCAAVWAAHVRARPGTWSWVRQLGTTSLFVYWVHLELVYGQLARPLSARLDLGASFAGFVVLTVLMVLVSVGKTKFTSRRTG